MTVTIILLILAVLLFGSSVVNGWIGTFFGLITAFIGLVYFSIKFSLEPHEVIIYLVLGLIVFLIAGYILLKLINYFDPLAREARQLSEELKRTKNKISYTQKYSKMTTKEIADDIRRRTGKK